MIQMLLFYAIAIILIVSVVMTISSRNSIRSSLLYLLVVLNVSVLLGLVGAKVIAVTLTIATTFMIAVLFLCGVLMLDINVAHIHRAFKQHVWLASIIGLCFVAELLIFLVVVLLFDLPETVIISEKHSNISILSSVLYTNYFYITLTFGVILLVAVVGVVILTARKKDLSKKDQSERKAQQLQLRAGSDRADEVGPC
jgi:NADH:ubiquinone oxidoreductase subunit 6 (subunit J)